MASLLGRYTSVALVLVSCLTPPRVVAQGTVTTVMTGLDNPRGLALGPEGALYVVEAGRGGAGPCIALRGTQMCFGETGALTRLWNGRTERVVTGLPSYISPTGEVAGPADVAFLYRGGAYLTVAMGNGEGNPAAVRAAFGPGAARLGQLLWVSNAGKTQVIADLSAHEFTSNPAGGPTDSNPFGVFADGRDIFVADAGANAVLRVDHGGRVSTHAVLPTAPARPVDAVATSIARGPDGALYVGELTGVPFTAGAARVYRLAPDGTPQVFAEGFKTIIDIAFGPDGSLYVLEHATGPVFFAGPGDIVRIARDGTRTVVLQGLDRPTSLVVDGRGTIYVTNHGLSAGAGEVRRFRP